MNWLVISLPLWLMACSGGLRATDVKGDDDDAAPLDGDDDDSAGDDDDDDNEVPTFDTSQVDTMTTETGTPGTTDTALTFLVPPNPQTMTLGYTFGWDSSARTIEEIEIVVGAASTVQPPTIEINIGDAAWTGDLAATGNYCTVYLPLYNAPEDAGFEALDSRLLQAFTYDPYLDTGITDCFDGQGADLDPLVWGTGLAIYLGNLGQWSIAVGGPDAYTLSILTPYLPGPDLLPEHLIGGLFRDAGFLLADIPEIYGFAWQVDNNFTAIVDASYYLQPIRLQDIMTGDTVVDAWYDMNSLFIWSFY